MRNVNLERWRGRRDTEVLEPERMDYVERPARRTCRGCCFEAQWSSICIRASAIAVRAGMNDCDAGFIYVLAVRDVRQIVIEITLS